MSISAPCICYSSANLMLSWLQKSIWRGVNFPHLIISESTSVHNKDECFLFNPLSVSFVCAVEASLKFQNQHLASRSKHGSRSKLGQPEFTPYEFTHKCWIFHKERIKCRFGLANERRDQLPEFTLIFRKSDVAPTTPKDSLQAPAIRISKNNVDSHVNHAKSP